MPPFLSGAALAAGPALPLGGAYVAGSGAITGSGSSLTVDQASKLGIIDWKSFSIGKGGSVSFDNAGGATLNRVVGGSLSSILGTLKASGTVYLINPQGVVIGSSGVVVTKGSFVASTLDLANSAFMAGGALLFKGTTNAEVVNLGKISSTNGDVFLIARSVFNDGTISAAEGTVGLAAGKQVLIEDASADERVFVQVGGADVTNAGTIQAASAELKAAGGNVYALAGSNGGIIRATGTAVRGGHVWLTASGGTVSVAGTVEARNADGTGGKITAQGETLKIAAKTVIDAAGTKGSGTIETSAHDVSIGAAKITAGKGGQWLLDPADLTIDAGLAATIESALNASTNVTETTTAAGSGGNGDIFVDSSIAWHTIANLTLSAYRTIAIGSGVSITNTSYGSLTLRADNTGTGTGTVKFGTGAKVDFTVKGVVSIYYNPLDGASTSTVNAQRYTSTVGYAGGSAGYSSEVQLSPQSQLYAYMLVNTLPDLQNVENSLGADYALGRDINASATAGWNSGAGFVPIGNASTPFTGIFDGGGHVVSGLTIDLPKGDDVGLFGSVAHTTYLNGTIKNVGVTGENIIGKYHVGGLVGTNAGLITNSYSTGTVDGPVHVGGLVGKNFGTVSNSYSSDTVSGVTAVGGLVGINYRLITRSYSTGAVFGVTANGGLVGLGNNGAIFQSYATGSASGVTGTGGLIGIDNGSSIKQSYSTGSATGVYAIGGLAGAANDGIISQSYATGAATGKTYVGGLVGGNNSSISQSYSSGKVTGVTLVGGLTGDSIHLRITRSYWDMDTSGQATSAGGIGLTTAQLQSGVDQAGWDPTVWGDKPGINPYLLWRYPTGP